MEEIWKDIEGYEDLYQVSNRGKVRSLRRNIILRQGITSNGYKSVNLYKNKGYKHFRIHRLVAEAFLPNPNNLPFVNHKDENKLNNCVENLEWCDGKYNLNYGTRGKRISQNKSKVVLQYSLDGTFVKEWKSTRDIQRMTGYSSGCISECCRNIRKSAYGYLWKYKNEEG